MVHRNKVIVSLVINLNFKLYRKKKMTNNNTVKLISDMTLKASDNMKQLGELQMNMFNNLMQTQVKTFNTTLEKSLAQSKLMTDAKSYEDVARGQIDFSGQLTESFVGNTRESMEIVQDAGTKFRSFAETTVQEASKEFNKAA
jgi:phasin family protein